MKLPINALFAGLFTLYFVRLAFEVIRLRRTHQVALGAGGVSELERAIRSHGNFAEYVPMGLILLGVVELNGLHPIAVAVLAGLFGIRRLLHAQSISDANIKPRVRSIIPTFTTLITLALINIMVAVRLWWF
jgi:uncharacterized membrane protein YecN with MAPEG domain